LVEGTRVGSERYRTCCGCPLVGRLMKQVYIVPILFENRIEYDRLPSIVSDGRTYLYICLGYLRCLREQFLIIYVGRIHVLEDTPAFRPTQWERDEGNEQVMGLVWVNARVIKAYTFFPRSNNPLAIIS